MLSLEWWAQRLILSVAVCDKTCSLLEISSHDRNVEIQFE